WEQWLLKIRSWLLEHGQKLTMQKVSVYGKEKIVPSSLIAYVRKAYQFTEEEEEQDEIEKDIWKLENLDIPYKKNLIKNYQTLNFTTIIQTDLREETKKAVYEHLHHEAITTISKEMTAIRRLSKYLKEKYPDIHSAEELDRELLEEYLTYLATEAEGVNNYRMDLTRLRRILETIGKLYGYPHLESLFLTSDFPNRCNLN
ncbi:Phage integrase family, partial [human gut metagenome]